jgi:hypothetical protein
MFLLPFQLRSVIAKCGSFLSYDLLENIEEIQQEQKEIKP